MLLIVDRCYIAIFSVCVCVCVCVCVVSVIVKRPVLPPSVVDGRSRNPLYYYCYYYYYYIMLYISGTLGDRCAHAGI